MIDGKQHLSNKKKAAAQRLMRTEAYAEKVRTLFAKTVNEILALNKTMPTLEDGVMYSFDGDSMKKQKEVEALLRRLSSTVTMAVQNGIKLEWDAANKECDQFITSVLGKKVLSTPEFTAYMDRNTAARDAFIGRTENGLDLSKRVWKSVKQLREEMEVAMTVAIGEGDSASSMSRKVREYLNNPDLMFRRFRYKKGEKDIIDTTTGEIVGTEPIYGRKWKKRIKEEKTGKYKWIDYDRDTYKSGTGVYKSSARNAMRVTRTETNIAYRRADNARWQNMDFVLGQHIELSRSHPKKDICDDLAGDYPKDFVFDGWHPQCFCVCTPILMDEAEMAKVTEAFLKGETYKPKGKPITEYPQNFKDWVTDHKDKIEIARKNGTEPYFLRNNSLAVDNIINPQPKKLTPLEIAEQRHAARTPEQIDAIKRAANNRTSTRKFANKILDYANNNYQDIDTTKLQQALKSGNDEMTLQEARTIKSAITKKKKLTKKAANNILKVAKGYNEVDYTMLQAAVETGDLVAMSSATKQVAKMIADMKKQEAALGDLIPNVHDWHQSVTMAELQGVHDAVKAKLAQWAGFDIEKQAKKLHFEAVDFLGGNMHSVQQKFPNTWKVSQAAYLKKLDEVNYKIGINEVQAQIKDAKAWSLNHPKATNAAKYIAEVEQAIANGDNIAFIKQKASIAVGEYTKKQALQAKNEAKKQQAKIAKQETKLQKELSDIETKLNNSAYIAKISQKNLLSLMDRQDAIKEEIKALHSQFPPDAYTQERKNAAVWDKGDGSVADKTLIDTAGKAWKNATEVEKDFVYEYTSHYCDVNEPLQGRKYSNNQKKERFVKKVNAITSYINKNELPSDMWFMRGDDGLGVIASRLKFAGETMPGNLQDLVGMTMQEGGFMSTGSRRGKGFSSKDVIINIYAPKGTKAAYIEPISAFGNGAGRSWTGDERYTSFSSEHETLFQRGTKMRITKVYQQGSKTYIDCEIIGQEVKDLSYVKDENIGW